VLLEVELESEDEAVELPAWAEGARDVSEDVAYTNAALARKLGMSS
jgi:CYTH domain-containing protein